MYQFRIRASVKTTIKNCCNSDGLSLSWSELLSLKGRATLPMQKAYQSTASVKSEEPVKKRIPRRRINPSPAHNLIMNNTKIMGVHIRQNILSWAVVKGDNTVHDWNCKPLSEELPVANLYNIVKMASAIADSLDACDIYVIEEPKPPKSTIKKVINLQMQVNHIYAVLLSCFLHREKSVAMLPEASNVYIMRSGTTAQQFHLRIGHDTLTTNYVIDPILEKMPMGRHLRSRYIDRSQRLKEEMNWALLNTLAFLEISRNMAPKKAKEKLQV